MHRLSVFTATFFLPVITPQSSARISHKACNNTAGFCTRLDEIADQISWVILDALTQSLHHDYVTIAILDCSLMLIYLTLIFVFNYTNLRI